jgi:hypothetical protein
VQAQIRPISRALLSYLGGAYTGILKGQVGMKTPIVSACGRVHGAYLLATYGDLWRQSYASPYKTHPDLAELTVSEYAFLNKHAEFKRIPLDLSLQDAVDCCPSLTHLDLQAARDCRKSVHFRTRTGTKQWNLYTS